MRIKLTLFLLVTACLLSASINYAATEKQPFILVSLEREGCLGPCPQYKIAGKYDGTVFYNGKLFAKITGRRVAKIDANQIKILIDAFNEAGFWQMKDSYEKAIASCGSHTTISLTVNDKKKTIRHNGHNIEAPAKLTDLENKIDEILNSKPWVYGPEKSPA